MDALIVSNVLLWLAVAGLAVVVWALTRQIGVLHERLAPAGALTLSGGLKAGETVPALTLTTLTGSALSLTSFAANGRAVLVFFLSPNCPVCKSLLPVVRRIADEERDWLELLLASDGGTHEEHAAYVEARNLDGLRYVVSAELGMTFQVGKLPYAALIDATGVLIAKGLVNTREHLESLFEARRLGVASIDEYIGAKGRSNGAKARQESVKNAAESR